MKNPKWIRDELILALDLYFELEPGQIHAKNPKVMALSDLLNQLPIHSDKKQFERFRNANGVGLKLSNFLALDDSYFGKGMSSTSKLDKVVFEEFKDQKDLFKKLANAIKTTLKKFYVNAETLDVEEHIEDVDFERSEGKILFRYHLARERNATLVKKKKQQVLKLHDRLRCELSKFDFFRTYGEIGYGFIECHHRAPLCELTESTTTQIDNLMLVCANCHRILHRG